MDFLQKKPNKIPLKLRGEAKTGLTRLVAARVLTLARPQKFLLCRLQAGQVILPCALGSAGTRHSKREGDHATPVGEFRVLAGFYRADRVPHPASPLPMRPIAARHGWCDDPGQPVYNRLVSLPCRFSHEKLWRDDHLYDLLIVLDYNVFPRRKNRGSAIFLHCCRKGFAPTEGCIALDPADLRRLLPRLSRKAVLAIK